MRARENSLVVSIGKPQKGFCFINQRSHQRSHSSTVERSAGICLWEAGRVLADVSDSQGSSSSLWVGSWEVSAFCSSPCFIWTWYPHLCVCTSGLLSSPFRPPTPVHLSHLGWQEDREPYNCKRENSLLNLEAHRDSKEAYRAHPESQISFNWAKNGHWEGEVRA